MTYDEARTELINRIQEHPKEGTVSEIISDLNFGDLADEASSDSRQRSMMLDGLLDTAKVHLFEEMGPSISEATIREREAGTVPVLFPDEDTEYPEHIYWMDRWTHFRTATILGQMYFTGTPAIKIHKDDGTVELGVMLKASNGGTTFRHLSEELDQEGTEKYIRQSRESHEESPKMHINVDVLCDGWERLLDEAKVFA